MTALVQEKRPWLVACATLTLYLSARWNLNTWVYPSFNDVLPVAREIATGIDVLVCLVLIALLLRFRRAVAIIRTVHRATPVLLLGSLGLFLAGVQSDGPSSLVAGAVLFGAADPWFFISASASLLALDFAEALLAVAVAATLQCLFSVLVTAMPIDMLGGYGIQVALSLACLGVAWRSVERIPEGLGEGRVGHSDIFVNPNAFIPASHPLFVSVVLSGILCGVALTYGSASSVPVQTPWSLLPLMVVLAVSFVRIRGNRALDALYLGAVVMFLAGLTFFSPALLTVGSFAPVGLLPNLLFSAGANCLLALALLTSRAIGRRNPADFIRIAVLYAGCICLGILIGATAGHLLNLLVPSHGGVVIWIFALTAVVFAGYNLVLLRTFSFDDVVSKVQRVRAPSVVAPSESFDERCRAIAEAFALTPREAEILQFYARGRSTAVVQEELVLSYNTVKTHVRNIYRKTDVHSQQELIDLVDNWSDARG